MITKQLVRMGFFGGCLVAAGLLGGCGRAAGETKGEGIGGGAVTKPALPPVPVKVMAARGMDLQRSVRIVGSLVGLETVTISNRVTGLVSKVYVDRGDRVKPNEKLLEIEPERFQIAMQESQATLEQTLARLGIKEIPADNFDVNATAPVKMARSEFDNAKMKRDASKPLYDAKVMKDFEWLDVDSAYKVAESKLEDSRDQARALLAQARQNRSQVDMRKKDFHDAIIVAPGGETPDGMKIDSYAVTNRRVSAGEYLREGTVLFTLVADGVLKLQARVPERYLAEIRNQAEVKFRVEAYPDEEFIGIVKTIDPAVDPASRTFLIEALVDNAKYSGRLRPGSFVPGQVLTKKEPGRVMVPLESVTSFVGVTKVYKLDAVSGNRVKSVDIVMGQQESVKDGAGKVQNWVEIAKGDIKPDDQVVVEGQTKLVDGSAVINQIRAAPAASGTQAAAQ